MVNALLFFREKKHTTNGAKRDNSGHYQDEIVPFEKFSVWFYHGNPIALYWHATAEIITGNCGWNTSTTKRRLNSLPGVNICQKDWQWYENGEVYKDRSDEIKALIKEAQAGAVTRNLSPFTVAFCPDNGTWDDAPFPHNQVQKEVDAVRAFLNKHHFKHRVAYVQTGNFCVRHDICVNGNTFREAVAILEKMPKSDIHYLSFQEVK